MLSDRVSVLFRLLQCTNTDIARFADCSPSNISRLKSGGREPRRDSKTVVRLAEGVYGYADFENLLPVLRELCGVEDSSREHMIPGIIAWLYESRDTDLSRAAAQTFRTVTPRSKWRQELLRQSFGEKLDIVMSLLGLPNAQLAALLSVDVSLVSRWRNGAYAPYGNKPLSEKLSAALLARAEKIGKPDALAALCAVPPEELSEEAIAAWLFEEDSSALAQMLLGSLDDFTPGQGLPAAAREMPPIQTEERYWGTDGLRAAAVRFLSDTAGEGGELLLYSDESMEWLSGDPEYFALWASLMTACVRNGVRIRIIHNVDRDGKEMADAIKGWSPLYISGMIEPYVFRKERNSRFCHTMFLRVGGACIHGFFPAEAKNRWYDYITEAARLEALQEEYDVMLASASPFLKTYPAAQRDAFRAYSENQTGERTYLLSGLPVAAMPEGLLARMLARADLDADRRSELISRYRVHREQFLALLRQWSVNMILSPGEEAPGSRRVNFSLDLVDLSLEYTREEYAEHVAAVIELVGNERNFHLTLLPSAPFRDIQIMKMKDACAVLRCQAPYAAFVFTNSMLAQSLSDYFTNLIKLHHADRSATIQMLEKLKRAESPDPSLQG